MSRSRAFDGVQAVYRHASAATGTPMRFGLYLPPQAAAGPVPVLYWLSGLTCTEDNFIAKAGAQRVAAVLGLALVVPDTSPRGLDLPGERDAWDFGVGAGFYVDATVAPWRDHYRMYTYVSEELPALVERAFPVDGLRSGIFGHSMGGHGALVIGLRNPGRFRSISAFAPIASSMRCPWGTKALGGYLGADRSTWRAYDATALIEDRGWQGAPLLVDQGLADPFVDTELRPELLEGACAAAGVKLDLRRRAGYDHSYFFIASFVATHLRFHAANMRASVTGMAGAAPERAARRARSPPAR